MRKIHYSILKRLNRWFRPRYSLVNRKGCALILDKNNWIDNRLLCFRRYEQENIDFLIESIQKQNFDRFLDIGANIGYFSMMIARHTDIPHIMSFEPLRKNYCQLVGNVFVNTLGHRIETYDFALSDAESVSKIYYDPESTGISTLAKDDNVRDAGDYTQSEDVTCKVFDDQFKIKDETLLIKMDVEQFEVPVLKGMTQFLSQNKILLMLEINTKESEAFSILETAGFKMLKQMGEDYIFTNFDVL